MFSSASSTTLRTARHKSPATLVTVVSHLIGLGLQWSHRGWPGLAWRRTRSTAVGLVLVSHALRWSFAWVSKNLWSTWNELQWQSSKRSIKITMAGIDGTKFAKNDTDVRIVNARRRKPWVASTYNNLSFARKQGESLWLSERFGSIFELATFQCISDTRCTMALNGPEPVDLIRWSSNWT